MTTASITQDEYRRIQAEAMPEAVLLQRVRDIGAVHGWTCYHTQRSDRSEKGFPDVTLVHAKAGRIVFAELKRQKEYLTPEQKTWQRGLLAVAVATEALTELDPSRADASPLFAVHVWRPSDLLDGAIEAVLRP